MSIMKVVDMAGKEVGEITLSDAIFGAEINKTVLHTAVRAYLMNQRQGTQSTLTRTEVSGGGKKPWKQKGTGHARQGSTRAPQWTHGGVALGPKPRCYRLSLNKKTKRVALFSALSSKVAANEMVIVDKIATESYSTKTMAAMLKAIGAAKKTLIVLPEVDAVVVKSCNNIEGVKTTVANSLNVYDILNCDTFVMAQGAAEKIQEVYAK
ncbi:MAG: 50S ribosomal protein L4 [Clostridia bacterium]|nr:50S ribosomal protein L4 [Clostridia bacterium]